MKKIFTLVALALSCSATAFCASPADMRYHCNNDTTEINALLVKGSQSGLKTANELVSFYGHQLLGTPYVAHTLEGEKEWLTIDIDELDCTTFVESLYALARTTLDGRTSWRDYAQNLESVRYRNGELGDYSSRLHYISDWIANNSYRGNFKEVTASIPGAKFMVKNLDFMSTHRESYPRLKDDNAMFEKIKGIEVGYRMHRYPFLKKEWLGDKKTQAALKDGDIIALPTKTDGLDVSHMAIIVKEGNSIKMLHASSVDKKVKIEKDDLKETLRRNRNWIGIRVIRIND